MSAQFSFRVIVTLALVIATQVAGSTMLVKTDGFRALGWSAACIATYAVSYYLLADTLRRGLDLSLALPILAALVPLATIALAVAVLGEQASWLRLGLLSLSCALIGVAASV